MERLFELCLVLVPWTIKSALHICMRSLHVCILSFRYHIFPDWHSPRHEPFLKTVLMEWSTLNFSLCSSQGKASLWEREPKNAMVQVKYKFIAFWSHLLSGWVGELCPKRSSRRTECGVALPSSTHFPVASLFPADGRGGKNESNKRVFVDDLAVAHIRENFVTGPHLLAGNSRKYILQLSSLGRMSLEEWQRLSATGLNMQGTKCPVDYEYLLKLAI